MKAIHSKYLRIKLPNIQLSLLTSRATKHFSCVWSVVLSDLSTTITECFRKFNSQIFGMYGFHICPIVTKNIKLEMSTWTTELFGHLKLMFFDTKGQIWKPYIPNIWELNFQKHSVIVVDKSSNKTLGWRQPSVVLSDLSTTITECFRKFNSQLFGMYGFHICPLCPEHQL